MGTQEPYRGETVTDAGLYTPDKPDASPEAAVFSDRQAMTVGIASGVHLATRAAKDLYIVGESSDITDIYGMDAYTFYIQALEEVRTAGRYVDRQEPIDNTFADIYLHVLAHRKEYFKKTASPVLDDSLGKIIDLMKQYHQSGLLERKDALIAFNLMFRVEMEEIIIEETEELALADGELPDAFANDVFLRFSDPSNDFWHIPSDAIGSTGRLYARRGTEGYRSWLAKENERLLGIKTPLDTSNQD